MISHAPPRCNDDGRWCWVRGPSMMRPSITAGKERDMGGKSVPGRHFLWTSLPGTATLLDYLISTGLDEAALIRDGDPEEYVQLVRGSLVAPLDLNSAPVQNPPPVAGAEVDRVTMKDILDGFSLQAATGRGRQWARGGVAHMLTLGYRSAAHHLRDEGLRFMEGVQCDFVNTIRTELQSPKWEAYLLPRIGGRRMECLLRRHFVFTPLQNHSFLQVSGRPLPEVIHEANRSSAPPPSHKRPLDATTTTSAGKPRSPPSTEEMDELPLRLMLYCDDFVRDVGPHPRSLLLAHRSEPLGGRAKRLAAHVCGGELDLALEGQENAEKKEKKKKKKRRRNKGHAADDAGQEEEDAPRGDSGEGRENGDGEAAGSPSLVCLLEQLLCRLTSATQGREVGGEGEGSGGGGQLARLLGQHCPLPPSVKALGRQRGGKAQQKGGKAEGHLACVAAHGLAEGYATQEDDEQEEGQGSQAAVGQGGMRAKGPRPHASGSSGGERLLDRCCSVASPPEQVLAFLNAVVRQVVPPPLLGSTHNFKVFGRALADVVRGGRADTLSCRRIADNLRTNDVAWWDSAGPPPSPACALPCRRRVLCRLVHVLLCELVLPLLRSTFYITEVDGLSPHALCFFRRPVWAHLRREALDSLVDGRFFRRLGVGQEEERQVLRTMAGPGTLGVSRLRLLPKKKGGVRLLALMSKPPVPRPPAMAMGPQRRGWQPTPIAVNRALQGVHQVLKYEYLRNPSLVGFGIFGLDDAVGRLQAFVRRVRAHPQHASCTCGAREGRRPLYFASVDMERCYDNIHVHQLLDIVAAQVLGEKPQDALGLGALGATSRSTLTSSTYCIRRYAIAHPFQSRDTVFVKHVREAYREEEWQSFPDMAQTLSQVYTGSVLTDGVLQTRLSKEDVLSLLTQHLAANSLFLPSSRHERRRMAGGQGQAQATVGNGSGGLGGFARGSILRQVRGISQGSLLSSMLCNMYLGAVENGNAGNRHSTRPAAHASLGARQDGKGLFDGIPSIDLPYRQGSGHAINRDQAKSGGLRAGTHATNGGTRRGTKGAPKRSGGPEGQAGQGGEPEAETLLLRLMDDYLLVSNSVCVARAFLDRVYHELPQRCSVSINTTKTRTNFTHTIQGPEGREGDGIEIHPTPSTGPDGAELFPWCGLLFRTRDCEVMADFSRMLHVHTHDDTPAARAGRDPGTERVCQQSSGRVVRQKVKAFLKPKLHPILLDSGINSRETVLLNVYEILLFTAHKSLGCFRSLSLGPSHNRAFLRRCICDVLSYAHRLILRRTSRRARPIGPDGAHARCDIQRPEVEFLGLSAFLAVLRRERRLGRALCSEAADGRWLVRVLERRRRKVEAGVGPEVAAVRQRVVTTARVLGGGAVEEEEEEAEGEGEEEEEEGDGEGEDCEESEEDSSDEEEEELLESAQ